MTNAIAAPVVCSFGPLSTEPPSIPFLIPLIAFTIPETNPQLKSAALRGFCAASRSFQSGTQS
jgi:hypothetical protein